MRISAITKCLCNLRDRVLALENQIDADTDEQTISLSGNTITLSPGITGGGGTIDLTQYLDNTDSQVLSASVVGTNLVLSISGGNTVNVPLASLGSDDQLLSLVGDNLTIEDGNTVDLSPYLDNTDNQTLSTTVNPVTGTTNSITVSGGNTVSIVHPGLLVNAQPIYEEHYAGGTNTTAQAWNRNLNLTRTAVGRWNATFVGAHPDGTDYHPTMTAEEQSGNRDTPDITVVQGSKTAAGFQIQITTGDNGGGADVYVDTPFTAGINAPQVVVTSVALS